MSIKEELLLKAETQRRELAQTLRAIEKGERGYIQTVQTPELSLGFKAGEIVTHELHGPGVVVGFSELSSCPVVYFYQAGNSFRVDYDKLTHVQPEMSRRKDGLP